MYHINGIFPELLEACRSLRRQLILEEEEDVENKGNDGSEETEETEEDRNTTTDSGKGKLIFLDHSSLFVSYMP